MLRGQTLVQVGTRLGETVVGTVFSQSSLLNCCHNCIIVAEFLFCLSLSASLRAYQDDLAGSAWSLK